MRIIQRCLYFMLVQCLALGGGEQSELLPSINTQGPTLSAQKEISTLNAGSAS